MTNQLALVLAIMVCAFFGADYILMDGAISLFLAKKMMERPARCHPNLFCLAPPPQTGLPSRSSNWRRTSGLTNFDTSPSRRAISFTSFEAIA